jgi:hypothetical protein
MVVTVAPHGMIRFISCQIELVLLRPYSVSGGWRVRYDLGHVGVVTSLVFRCWPGTSAARWLPKTAAASFCRFRCREVLTPIHGDSDRRRRLTRLGVASATELVARI